MNEMYWIDKLCLEKHPEGGYFKETYRSQEQISKEGLPSRFSNNRSFSTAIYFILASHDFSAFHRIHSDELWHFYQGATLEIIVIHLNGTLEKIKLGANAQDGSIFQAMVPAGAWFASRLLHPQTNAYSLVGCTVAPGFDFADLEMAQRENLVLEFPQHQAIIAELTRF